MKLRLMVRPNNVTFVTVSGTVTIYLYPDRWLCKMRISFEHNNYKIP